MTSPLAGSLARTIGKALAGLFLPATLTRGNTSYPCRAIYEDWGKSSGPGGLISTPDVKAILLAASLPMEPATGDVVALQGSTFVVVSNKDTVNAVSTDPARATFTLIGKFVTGSSAGAAAVDPPSAYAAVAAAMGQSYTVYRSAGSNPLATAPVETTPVVVTSAKAAGFSYTRSSSFDDLLFALQADFTNIRIGDFLVGPGGTFFVADMPGLRPVVAVVCNATLTLTRPGTELAPTGGQAPALPSQPGSQGSYWGMSEASAATPGAVGETTVRSNIPAALIGTTGRATGTGELPSDAPGPSRWRVYLPQSAFPKGSVQDRDIVTDDQGARYQVSVAGWTSIGYRLEAVRLEN